MKARNNNTAILIVASLNAVRSYIKFGANKGYNYKVVAVFNEQKNRTGFYKVTVSR